MPKTLTNDIAPVLPSSIDGPFQVVDPSDSSSWIKVDPANAQIASAGGARAIRSLTMGYVRVYLNTGIAVRGKGLTARTINAGLDGGVYTAATRIPNIMDLSAPARVIITIAPFADALMNGQTVRLRLGWTRVTPAGVETEGELDNDWNLPNDWKKTEPKHITYDNGSGDTFAGGSFTAGDVVGFRFSRVGAAVEDTFIQPLTLFEHLTLDYTARLF